MKYFESTSVFHFSWDQVAQGFWRRYPNPHSNHVLSEDTVSREIRGSKLFTKRLLTKTNRVPKWGECFVNSRTVKIVEESVMDPNEKILITYTRNIGYVRVMVISIVEKVIYKVSKENPNWTVAERSAWIDSQVFGFGRAIQAFGLERFRKNCQQMVGGFNHVLMTMFPLTATSLPHTTSDETTSQLTPAKKETLKDAAKKATDIAKSKAGPIYASCQPNQT
ncbi:Protein preli-like [Cryptotermes secundus]|uniref:Protein preli-like n=1 Tax=Cryptotermes secundus TaxID=105785 RepID=A0A2J7QIP8_9NEOP|nr:Protein preli-like [Cryptotermes secundus]